MSTHPLVNGAIFLLTAVSLIILTLLVCYVAYLCYIRRRYCHIPGPPVKNFFLGHLQYLQDYRRKGKYPFEILVQWAQEYGPLFKIFILHQCIVIPTGESSIKELLTKRKYPKSHLAYDRLKKLCGERFLGSGLVTTIYHDDWYQKRKSLNPAFHRRTLQSMMHEFNEMGDYWTRKLEKYAESGGEFKMADQLNRISLDVIGKVGFDLKFNAMSDHQCLFVKALSKVIDGLTESIHDPIFEIKYSKRKLIKEVKEALRFLRNFGEKEINRKIEEVTGKEQPEVSNIMAYLIKRQVENPDITIRETLDDFLTLFIAGQETISHALSFMLCEAGRNPEVIHRLVDEIDKVIGDNPDITYQDLNRLDYMTKVWKETLRLYPPAPATARETTDDVVLEGFKLPKGTFFMINFFAIHRLECHFPDAEAFLPDRWGDESPTPLFAFLPFSLGYRACMGKQFAEMEYKIIICKFLQKYQYNLNLTQSFEVQERSTLRPRDGAVMTITKRY